MSSMQDQAIPGLGAENLVECLFEAFLGRKPDDQARTYYAERLREGATLTDLMHIFGNADEFSSAGGVSAFRDRLRLSGSGEAHALSDWPDLYTIKNVPFFMHRDLFRPAMLMIETTNICNNDCVICPYSDQTRRRQTMSTEIFEAAIQQYIEIGGGPVSLTPIVGEVFLDKLLPERLRYLASAPSITSVSATTNAVLAKRYEDDELTALLALFKRVKISIYGLDAEEYAQMTRKDQYEEAMVQIVRILKLSPPDSVVVGIRQLRTRQPEDVNSWLEALGRRAGQSAPLMVSNADEYANWSHFDTSKPLPLGAKWKPVTVNTEQCLIPLAALEVMADGSVSFCACANFDGSKTLMLGNVGTDTLANMLGSDAYKALWRWKEHGVPDFCKTCSFHMPMTAIKNAPWMVQDPVRFVGG